MSKHSQRRETMSLPSVESGSHKLCMQIPTQETVHFIVKCVKTFYETILTSKHTEEKPYNCEVCQKCLTQTLHEKSNIGKNPFYCQVCENSLGDNFYIKTHTKKRNHIIVKSVQSVSQIEAFCLL